MTPPPASRLHFVLTAYFGAVLALAVARFASTPENLRYQLLLLLLPAAFVVSVSWTKSERKASIILTLAGVVLLLQAAFQPTTEARGYVLAAIAWLSFFVALRLGSSRRLVSALLLVLITIGAGEALYGLLQAVGGVDQIGDYTRGLDRTATGTFINRNHFAGCLNMTLGLSLGALYTGFARRRHDGQRSSETFAWTWLIILSCTVIGLAVFLSTSRGGSLILIATLVFVFVLLQIRGQRRGRHALPSRVALVLLVATLAVGFSYGVDALLERFDTFEQSARPQVYRDTLRMIADHPWTGVGPGMYGYRFRAYQTVGLGSQFSQAHNDYLQVAAEWGLPLTIVFWAFVGWVFVGTVRLFLSRASPWRQGVGLGCAAAIFSLLLHSLVDFNLQIPANLAVFAAILGLGLAARPTRPWGPNEVRPQASFPPAWTHRLLLLGILPLALLAAAWRVVPRAVATQIAAGKQDLATIERAAAWDPQNPDYPYLLGRYHRDLSGLRNLETARRHSERAAELAPWGWRAHWQLAQLYELLAEPQKAEQALLRATALSPRDPTMQWRLANLYLRLGDLERMAPALETALAGDSSLLRPALGLLTKTGSDLATIDRVWPTAPADRLILLEGLSRGTGGEGPPDPEWHAFLLSEWNKILASSEPPEVARAAFFVSYLLAEGDPDEARQGWILLAAANDLEDVEFESEKNLLWNGRFELPLSRSPLDWRISEHEGYAVAVTADEGVYDSIALRIDFDGTKNLDFAIVRQTALVRPGASHELTYRTRSEGLTTDQGLFLEVYDPGSRQVLLRTAPVIGTTPWSLSLATFETPPTSDRIELRLSRLRSRQIDSRLAGTFWLDNVAMSFDVKSSIGQQDLLEIETQ